MYRYFHGTFAKVTGQLKAAAGSISPRCLVVSELVIIRISCWWIHLHLSTKFHKIHKIGQEGPNSLARLLRT
jgi:hypothetical protein